MALNFEQENPDLLGRSVAMVLRDRMFQSVRMRRILGHKTTWIRTNRRKEETIKELLDVIRYFGATWVFR